MTHRPSQRLSRRMTHGASVHTKGFKVAKGRKAISPLNHRIRLKGGVEALESNYRHERHFRRKAFLNAKGFKKLHFCHVRKGMGRGTQRA